MASSLLLREFHGAELEPYLEALGMLRIRVFREYPYLYDGSLEYEREYLRCYVNSPHGLVVLAFDDNQPVGATTCLPVEHEGPEFQKAFLRAGYDLREICYFGESILLPEYRGQGIGKEFFRRREAHSQSLGGIRYTAFCAIDRPKDHPSRPSDYRPLDAFWLSQGYIRHPELTCELTWKELTEESESAKTLTFWLKDWR